jgi:uncharacterized protein YndB with AHSA1/START domain
VICRFFIWPPQRLHGRCTQAGSAGRVALIRRPSGWIRAARAAYPPEEIMTAVTQDALAVQTHRIFIKATPEDIWDALTRPGWTQKYGYRAAAQYDLRPGGLYLAFATGMTRLREARDVIIDGEVIAAERPWRLVQTWHVLFDPRATAESDSHLTWQIEERDAGVCALSVSHDLTGAPRTAELAAGRDPLLGGGWTWVLSDLKTLLETGRPLPG